MSAEVLARAWWTAMDAGDYRAAADLLAPGATVDWPLSTERFTSPGAWCDVNERYPGKGPWRAIVLDLVAEADRAVTFTRVTDGSIQDLAISHFRVADGRITHLVEFWPETYATPTWRQAWSTPLPDEENPLKARNGV